MSSGAGNTFGTNSPPLEQGDYMGVSGMSGKKADAVPDTEQRKAYFEGSSSKDTTTTKAQSELNVAPTEKVKKD